VRMLYVNMSVCVCTVCMCVCRTRIAVGCRCSARWKKNGADVICDHVCVCVYVCVRVCVRVCVCVCRSKLLQVMSAGPARGGRRTVRMLYVKFSCETVVKQLCVTRDAVGHVFRICTHARTHTHSHTYANTHLIKTHTPTCSHSHSHHTQKVQVLRCCTHP
jgi:hypothetical protein